MSAFILQVLNYNSLSRLTFREDFYLTKKYKKMTFMKRELSNKPFEMLSRETQEYQAH